MHGQASAILHPLLEHLQSFQRTLVDLAGNTSCYYALVVAYVLAARMVMRSRPGGWKDPVFALLNLAGLYCLFFCPTEGQRIAAYLFYVGLVIVSYGALRLFVNRAGRLPWLAFFTPILFLILIRYAPAFHQAGARLYGPVFIGISYLAFRSSYLVLEIRNGRTTMPSFWRYLGFCFFLPTLSVGPINRYSEYQRGFGPRPEPIPAGRALLRILAGFTKYKLACSLLFPLTYTSLLFDDHYHHWIDLPVAMAAYYLFLYCNFSGFCDLAIGAAGFIGIPVNENFDNPLAARNMREFWNRWHISLSQWMRDVVFAPLSKLLVGWFGPARANHAIALTITVVFLLVGIWHGVGWNYAAFGLAQALGVVTVHYYTIFLKKKLGRDGFKAYNENRWIHAAAVAVTFCYYAATLFLFANTGDEMKQIFSILR